MSTKLTARVRTGGLQVSAEFIPASFNRELRTIDVVFGTETPVLVGFYARYYEIISFQGDDCDLSRLNDGAPMLDNHDRTIKSAKQPGVVMKAWVENNKGYATLRFAKHQDAEDLMNNVADGIVKKVSVGYTVQTYEEVIPQGTTPEMMASDDYIPTLRAIKWQPFEISFTPVPADNGAGVRSRSANENEHPNYYEANLFYNTNTNSMRRLFYDNGAAEGGGGNQGGNGAAGGGTTPPATTTPETPTTTPATPPAAEPAPGAQATPGVEGGERGINPAGVQTREMQIFEAGEIANLPISFVRSIAANPNLNVQQARAAIVAERSRLDAERGTDGQNRSITVGDGQAQARAQAMSDAIAHRANPGLNKLTEGARAYRGMSLLDMAREAIGWENSRSMTPREIAEKALGLVRSAGALHSTSDFPVILGNTINRTLRAEYEAYPSTWRQFCVQANFRDFREKTSVQLSEGSDMELVKEGEEYKRMTLTEGSEKYKIAKYGRIIGVTWETIVNDDLGAFSKLPRLFAEMAKRKQDDIVYGILTGNPLMGDGINLFNAATHKNLITGPGTTINVDNLGIMRALIRKQKGLAGKTQLNLMPKFLVVGPDLEQLAMQYMSSAFVPTAQSGINPWAGSLTLIVEPRLTGNQWYMIADPRQIDTIEYGFLDGEGELYTTQREGFDVDGLEIKARMTFGAKAIDWRAFAKNTGA